MAAESSKSTLAVILVALGLTLLSLAAHLIAPSTMRESETVWEERLEMHRTQQVFASRPFTNVSIAVLHNTLGLSVKESFFLLQFLLLFFTGPLFLRYLSRLGFEFPYAFGGMFLFYLSLPVFLAHFAPVFTWSDFWTYAFVTGALLFALQGRIAAGAGAMAFAILARETSIIFLPFWAWMVRTESNRSVTALTVWSLAVIMIVVAVRAGLMDVSLIQPGWEIETRLFLLEFNFANASRARDTLFSLFVAFGMLWPIAINQVCRCRETSAVRGYRVMRWGAIATTAVFVVMTLLFMNARETRLFFPPFVFIIPLVLLFIKGQRFAIRDIWLRSGRGRSLAGLLVLLTLSIMVAVVLFPEFDFRKWQDGNRAYFGLHLAGTVVWLLVLWRSRQLNNTLHEG